MYVKSSQIYKAILGPMAYTAMSGIRGNLGQGEWKSLVY